MSVATRAEEVSAQNTEMSAEPHIPTATITEDTNDLPMYVDSISLREYTTLSFLQIVILFDYSTVRPYVHIYNIRNHVDIWSTSTQARARFIRFV